MENFGEIRADEQHNHEQHSQPAPKTASVWRRFLAFMIDNVIITFIVLAPTFIFGPFFGAAPLIGILSAAFLLYAIKDMIKGQSPGKFILGIAVRSQTDDSKIPSVAKLFLRNIFVFLWPIDFFILVFSKTKIGDKLVKTNVYLLSKKPKVIIRLAVLSAIAVLIPSVIQIGMGSRSPLSAEEFTSRMEEAGFVVEDIMYRFAEDDSLESALIVTTYYFLMEFAVFSTDAYARMTYNVNRHGLEAASRGMASSHTSVDMPNFNRFAKIFDGQYIVISRIENTFIFALSSSADRAAMDGLLAVLGY
jgi:uncharacterized RDD family membrane protein YckC